MRRKKKRNFIKSLNHPLNITGINNAIFSNFVILFHGTKIDVSEVSKIIFVMSKSVKGFENKTFSNVPFRGFLGTFSKDKQQ